MPAFIKLGFIALAIRKTFLFTLILILIFCKFFQVFIPKMFFPEYFWIIFEHKLNSWKSQIRRRHQCHLLRRVDLLLWAAVARFRLDLDSPARETPRLNRPLSNASTRSDRPIKTKRDKTTNAGSRLHTRHPAISVPGMLLWFNFSKLLNNFLKLLFEFSKLIKINLKKPHEQTLREWVTSFWWPSTLASSSLAKRLREQQWGLEPTEQWRVQLKRAHGSTQSNSIAPGHC